MSSPRERAPREWAEWRESSPRLPAGSEARVSGYGIMGIPFDSGHVLGLRRWTASSVGQPFTSIWHRAPAGVWTFHEDIDCDIACSRWFGNGTQGSRRGEIKLDWTGPYSLRIVSEKIDWSVELATTPMMSLLNAVSGALPTQAWHSKPVLHALEAAASTILGSGRVGLTGKTANGQDFMGNPQRVWRIVDSSATINGKSIGKPAPLAKQARLGDFRIPQRGIFAVGQAFVSTTP